MLTNTVPSKSCHSCPSRCTSPLTSMACSATTESGVISIIFTLYFRSIYYVLISFQIYLIWFSFNNCINSLKSWLSIIVFVLAYSLVPFENTIHLRKSKPVLLAAGIVWVLLSIAYIQVGDTHTAHEAIKHSLLEYAELFLFLLAAMTYINAMEERNVFQALRSFFRLFWPYQKNTCQYHNCDQIRAEPISLLPW